MKKYFALICLFTSLPFYAASNLKSVLEGSIIVSYYGSPLSNRMGVLGEGSIEEIATKIKAQAQKYQKLTNMKVIPAFHLIYATIWPDANVGLLSDKTVLRYINYAEKNDMLVILDHQIGKNGVTLAMRQMLRFLKYDNVHLAIDPEWSTRKPSQEIGSVNARDINLAQEMMQEYINSNSIAGKKILIVHQFNSVMIRNVTTVKSGYPNIDLIHNMDGYGDPGLKMETWNFIKNITNMPVKGFKLFYPKPWKKIGFDQPMMSESQVLSLSPIPKYINYQ